MASTPFEKMDEGLPLLGASTYHKSTTQFGNDSNLCVTHSGIRIAGGLPGLAVMSIQVQCTHCHKSMNVKDSASGTHGLCPFCKHEITVPPVTKALSPPNLVTTEPVTVKKRLLGGYTVNYNCPRCTTALKSKLEEAGNHDTCPECGAQLVVPGKQQLSDMVAAKELEARNAREREEHEYQLRENERRLKEEVEAERLRREEERRQEEAQIQAERAKHAFDYPIQYTVNHDGMIEYRDHFFEVMHTQLRVNPNLDTSEGRLIIKSIQLFKKHVGMTKKENANDIREAKAYHRQNKPRIQKSRHKGFVAGLVNISIEASRASHAASLEHALGPLEARKAMYDELLFACDQLIHQVEIRMAGDR